MEHDQDPLKIAIFHTNDMHGRLDAMTRLSSFARRMRAEAVGEGRLVFFWDAGDAADRSSRLCSLTKGAAFAHILSAMGYDLQTMGNAISLPYGPQAMKAVASRANYPILGANLRDGEGPLVEGLLEYVLISLAPGLKMGVFGLTAPFGNLYELFGLHMPDFLEVARRLVSRLQQERACLIVALSHLGLDEDRQLAGQVPGIDLIIGGHSHHALPHGEERGAVLIAQAGQYAEMLGRVDLTLDRKTGRVLARSAQVLEVPAGEPQDPAVLAAIAAAEREVAEIMAQPVGVLETALDLDFFHECGIGNLAADALCERMGAEAALVCSGQFHRGLPGGTVTFGQLDEACFSSANPGLSEVRGDQLLAALERGLDPAINRFELRGLRGSPYGIPQISGMQVEYDPEAPVGGRVRRVLVQGRPLDPGRRYRLAHTDAETIPEVGFLTLEEGQQAEYEIPTILREVIEDYISRHSPIPEPDRGRWRPASV